MKSFLTLTAICAVSCPFASAATNISVTQVSSAVSSSDDGLYWIQTVPNPTTGTGFAAQTASSSSAAGICGDVPDICPSCDGQVIKDASGTKYSVTCSASLRSTDQYEVKNRDAVNTTRLCLEACDDFDGCVGVTYFENGDCVLATGEIEDIASIDGGVEKVALLKVASTTSTSMTAPVTANAVTTSFSTITPSTVLNRTMPTNATVPPSETPKVCNLTDISCPECEGGVVTDGRNQTYTVFCDKKMYSEGDYAVQRWTSPSGCLLMCDDYTWCDGATFWPQGNCQLARGENVFPVEETGHIAFLPVATVLMAPATSPSAYPSDAGYTPMRPTSSPTTLTTFTVSPPSASTTDSCRTSAPTCPQCDGVTITDRANQTYGVRCNTEPACDDIIESGPASQQKCMSDCDADPICFAALWEDGWCDLCEGGIDDLLASNAYPAAVVLLPKFDVNVTNSTTNSTTTGTASGWHASTLVTSLSSSASLPSLGVDTFSCPAADGSTYQNPADHRQYGIQCDTGFGAASQRFLSASNFDACAAECTADCYGFRFGSSSSCGLYTSISVISSVTGWTAGVYIMYPATAEAASTTTSIMHPGQTFMTAPAPSSSVKRLSVVQPGGPLRSAPGNAPSSSSVSDKRLSIQPGGPMISAPPPSSSRAGAPITATISDPSVSSPVSITASSSAKPLSVVQPGGPLRSASAPSSSRAGAPITATISNPTVYSPSATSVSNVSSISFVPPLTNGSVSYATPGGPTKRA